MTRHQPALEIDGAGANPHVNALRERAELLLLDLSVIEVNLSRDGRTDHKRRVQQLAQKVNGWTGFRMALNASPPRLTGLGVSVTAASGAPHIFRAWALRALDKADALENGDG